MISMRIHDVLLWIYIYIFKYIYIYKFCNLRIEVQEVKALVLNLAKVSAKIEKVFFLPWILNF